MKLTINDVLKQKPTDPIWALNKTRGENRGPVMFEAPKLNGVGVDTARVPDTFIPISLTEQLPREQLLSSVVFRGCVRSKMLELIDEEEAEDMLSKPGVAEEIARLDQQATRHAGAAAEVLGEGGALNPNGGGAPEGVSPKVEAILGRIAEQGEVAVINSLRSFAEDLTREDRAYIENVADTRGFGKLLQAVTRGSLSGV